MVILVRIALRLIEDALRWVVLLSRSTEAVQAENLFLRRQLALYIERGVTCKRSPFFLVLDTDSCLISARTGPELGLSHQSNARGTERQCAYLPTTVLVIRFGGSSCPSLGGLDAVAPDTRGHCESQAPAESRHARHGAGCRRP